MKFTVERSEFLEALLKVQNIVANKTTLQVLSNALVEAKGTTLTICTTNLDISIKCIINAVIEEEGKTTLPIKRLVSFVRELPASIIEVEVGNDGTVTFVCGATSGKFSVADVDTFPKLQDISSEVCFRINGGVLCEMLRNTVYSASSDETRGVITGVLFSFKEGKLSTVATDGRRLSMVETENEFPPEMSTDVVLPSRCINEILHIVKENSEVRIYILGTKVFFECDNIVMSSKIIDQAYPNYRQVIPSSFNERIEVNKEELIAALKRISSVATDKVNTATFLFHDNELVVMTQSPDIGEVSVKIPIKYAGAEMLIAFNAAFMLEPLRNISSDNIYFEITDNHTPVMLKCDLQFVYVLMPLRLDA